MNEQTTKLIQQLADKFGTTAEHLWSVLIRQAPISCGIELTVYALIGLTLILGWGIAARLLAKADDEEVPLAACFLLLAATLIYLCCFLSDAGQLASGFFNPEYWALKQIVK